MRGDLRLGAAFLLAWLSLGQAPAHAQSSDSGADAPAASSIGPRELEGFSLEGTVTRSADPAQPAAEPAQSRTVPPRPAPDQPVPAATAERPRERRTDAVAIATSPEPRSQEVETAASVTPRRSSITVDLPPIGTGLAASASQTAFPSQDNAPELAPQSGMSLWPWLLAAMALGAGAAFLLWRRSHREAFAGGPAVDAFVSPQPPARAPQPPAASPPPAKPPVSAAPAGIVSTRLRPWIDLTFEPIRCMVEDERVTFEFDLALYNSGSAPARDVLIEASTFNAGPTQDQEIGQFFDNPVGEGERISAIPPLKSFNLRTRVSVERNKVRVLEAGGRHVFVPLMAFNAVYRWGSGEGQSSAAYLLGRDTKGEKMAPFRLDLGARVFRGVGQRALPTAVRT